MQEFTTTSICRLGAALSGHYYNCRPRPRRSASPPLLSVHSTIRAFSVANMVSDGRTDGRTGVGHGKVMWLDHPRVPLLLLPRLVCPNSEGIPANLGHHEPSVSTNFFSSWGKWNSGRTVVPIYSRWRCVSSSSSSQSMICGRLLSGSKSEAR